VIVAFEAVTEDKVLVEVVIIDLDKEVKVEEVL
jgi:hypothetical protein